VKRWKNSKGEYMKNKYEVKTRNFYMKKLVKKLLDLSQTVGVQRGWTYILRPGHELSGGTYKNIY